MTTTGLRVVGLALGLLSVVACDSPSPAKVKVVDLVRQTHRRETAPPSGRFDVVERVCGDRPLASILTPAASRIIWPLHLPDGAVFRSEIALDGPAEATALFRVGISDDRRFEALASVTVAAADCAQRWTPIEVDLGKYSGWKWSLFYQPRRREWRVVLGTNPVRGQPSAAHWAMPGIYSDTQAAARFWSRQGRP